jgi:tetratricopeptide (TPR) repeat protein
MRILTSTLLLANVLFLGCSTLRQSGTGGGTIEVDIENASYATLDPELERQSRGIHQYLLGQLHYYEEDFDSAYENFKTSSELLGSSAPLMDVRLAELHLRAGELKEALTVSERALEGDPENVSLMLMHAGILESLDRNEDAIMIYQSIIQRQPELTEAHLLLASTYLKEEQAKEAIKILQPLLEKYPDRSILYYYLGRAYELDNQLALAEQNLIRAYELSPSDTAIVRDVVRVMAKAERYDQARVFCEAALQKHPDDLSLRKLLSQLLIGENKLDEALVHLTQVESLEADPSETRFKIALIHIQRRQFLEAYRELNLVLSSNPDHGDARYYLGTVYASSGYPKEAIEELLKVKIDQDSFVRSRGFAAHLLQESGDQERAEKIAREGLGAPQSEERIELVAFLVQLLQDQQRYDEAEKLLVAELAVNPNDISLRFNYGIILSELNRTEESISAMEQVIERDPQNSEAMNFIAYLLADEGKDLQQAEKLIKQALAIRPNDGFYLDTYGWILYRQQRYEAAEVQLKRAVLNSGSDPVIAEHYGDVLTARKKWREALGAYQGLLQQIDSRKLAKTEPGLIERVKQKIQTLIAEHPELQPK